jgi:hypothetical protein
MVARVVMMGEVPQNIVVTELARDPRDPYEAKRTHPLRERCRYAYRGGLSRAVRAEQPT